MANLEAVVRGNEQLILLPIQAHTYTLPTDDSVVVELNPGMLSAVMSGYAGITGGGDDRSAILADGDGFLLRVSDDEQVFDDTVTWLVGPVWRDLVQFSANVSPAGIISLDSDEVDHSSWELAETKARAVSADGRRTDRAQHAHQDAGRRKRLAQFRLSGRGDGVAQAHAHCGPTLRGHLIRGGGSERWH